jgi:hypothetical protein
MRALARSLRSPASENKTAAFSGGAWEHLRRAAMPVNAAQHRFSRPDGADLTFGRPQHSGAVEKSIAMLK